MHRLTRTRRLSIAAMVSLLLFVAVAGEASRSCRIWDQWHIGNGKTISLENGCILYTHVSGVAGEFPVMKHASFDPKTIINMNDRVPASWIFAGFSERYRKMNASPFIGFFRFSVPIWASLIPLLILPVRWLIGRPANAPALPVITR